MSHVKKDILNGWKEIAGYLARDRRTVERWEKQRGLPVRRVPGAGRATVYALISELDEWLASSKPDEAETADEEQGAAEPGSGAISAFQAQSYAQGEAEGQEEGPDRESAVTPGDFETGARALSDEAPPVKPSLTNGKGSFEQDAPTGATAAPHAATALRATVRSTVRRRERMATWIVLVGLGLIFLFALPVVRRHFNPGIERAKSTSHSGEGPITDASERPNANAGGAISATHDHSQVAGVDELYLEGIYSLEQRTPESLERAEQDFASAIAKDAHCAPAYAALSTTYLLLREYYVMPDEEAFTKAKAAAQHAVALDPRLSDAHASMGFIDFFWLWDTANAEREFRTALGDDPSSAHAHHWYGSMLTHEGRFQEAMEQLNLAQRLEPTSAAILSTRAYAMGLSGHRGEAVDVLEELVNESPDVSSPHAILATLSRIEPPDWGRYLDEMRRAGELRHSDEVLQVASAAEPALHSGGERGMWAAILAIEEKLHPGSADRTFLMVEAEAALGHDDAAFADLNQLTQRHDPEIMGVIIDPTLAPLRPDPRFRKLLASIGLPAPPE